MPQDPPDSGVDPDEQPTQPLPVVPPEAAGAGAGADAPTAPYEPVPGSTEPIAPYVPIADPSGGDVGGVAPPPPAPPGRKSPVPWLIAAAVAIMGAAIALGVLQPWANDDPPAANPTPTESVSPSVPPAETPTEGPDGEPSPPDGPAPAPEPEPEPEPEPTVTVEPSPNPSPTPTGVTSPPAIPEPTHNEQPRT